MGFVLGSWMPNFQEGKNLKCIVCPQLTRLTEMRLGLANEASGTRPKEKYFYAPEPGCITSCFSSACMVE